VFWSAILYDRVRTRQLAALVSGPIAASTAGSSAAYAGEVAKA
jgi:hypothetical protein